WIANPAHDEWVLCLEGRIGNPAYQQSGPTEGSILELTADERDGQGDHAQDDQPAGGVFVEETAEGPDQLLQGRLATQGAGLVAEVALVLPQHLLPGGPVAGQGLALAGQEGLEGRHDGLLLRQGQYEVA